MRVADKLADDALEDLFLVGHQGDLERRQIVNLASVGQFHSASDRGRGECELLLERGSLPINREFFHVAILDPFAPNRVVVFKGETQGIDLRMTAGAALELLVLRMASRMVVVPRISGSLITTIGRWIDAARYKDS